MKRLRGATGPDLGSEIREDFETDAQAPDETPDWLTRIQQSEPDASPPVDLRGEPETSPSEEGAPDWLERIQPVVEEQPDQIAEEPDLLSRLGIPAAAEGEMPQPGGEEAAPAVPSAFTLGVKDTEAWLREVGEAALPGESASAPGSEEGLPGWLQAEVPDAAEPPISTAGEGLPGWLQAEEPEVAQPSGAPIEPFLEAELSTWLGAEALDKPDEPEAAIEIEPPAEGIADWLSGLIPEGAVPPFEIPAEVTPPETGTAAAVQAAAPPPPFLLDDLLDYL
ncbi:MAG: hypothetical protein U1B80_08980, partial [Anaerolineaceae bacterium]|nr:hypothetical protein [Anaerolineaceae bacterium]